MTMNVNVLRGLVLSSVSGRGASDYIGPCSTHISKFKRRTAYTHKQIQATHCLNLLYPKNYSCCVLPVLVSDPTRFFCLRLYALAVGIRVLAMLVARG